MTTTLDGLTTISIMSITIFVLGEQNIWYTISGIATSHILYLGYQFYKLYRINLEEQ